MSFLFKFLHVGKKKKRSEDEEERRGGTDREERHGKQIQKRDRQTQTDTERDWGKSKHMCRVRSEQGEF